MKDRLIQIRYARLEEKQKVYQWLYCSETTSLHSGPPNYPQSPVPSWEEFQMDYEDYYFISEGRFAGSVMIIEKEKEEIGCVCYASFHLFPRKAELDIWMKDLEYCGKGYGPEVLKQLVLYLKEQFAISDFIVRPSTKNVRAIRAYEKAGFRKISDSQKRIVILQYVNKHYFNILGQGDYGFEDTAILTLTI